MTRSGRAAIRARAAPLGQYASFAPASEAFSGGGAVPAPSGTIGAMSEVQRPSTQTNPS
jgi:hypothetical protein